MNLEIKENEVIIDGVSYIKRINATEEGQKLIEEAKKRGFKKGIKYITAGVKSGNGICEIQSELQASYFTKTGWHLSDGFGGAVYNDGKWADILKKDLPVTRKEYEEFLYQYYVGWNSWSGNMNKFLDQYFD